MNGKYYSVRGRKVIRLGGDGCVAARFTRHRDAIEYAERLEKSDVPKRWRRLRVS